MNPNYKQRWMTNKRKRAYKTDILITVTRRHMLLCDARRNFPQKLLLCRIEDGLILTCGQLRYLGIGTIARFGLAVRFALVAGILTRFSDGGILRLLNWIRLE